MQVKWIDCTEKLFLKDIGEDKCKHYIVEGSDMLISQKEINKTEIQTTFRQEQEAVYDDDDNICDYITNQYEEKRTVVIETKIIQQRIQFVKCKSCNRLSTRKYKINTTESHREIEEEEEEGEISVYEGELIEYEEVIIPNENNKFIKLSGIDRQLPLEIQNEYRKLIYAYNNSISNDKSRSNVASIIRGLTEAILEYLYENTSNEIKTRLNFGDRTSLKRKMTRLHEYSEIEEIEAKYFHFFRALGNKSLHGRKTPRREYLKWAIEFMEYFLKKIFGDEKPLIDKLVEQYNRYDEIFLEKNGQLMENS